MKWILRIARFLLGLIFIIFGLNGLFTFIPVPEFHPFMQQLVDSNLIVVVKILEIIGGLLLLSGRYTLVGIIVLGPIVVNIVLYHLLLDPRNMAAGFVNLVLYGIIVVGYWNHLKILLNKKPASRFE